MKKLIELRNKAKENNKGFSLVELIVVIAIMAVLVAVLVPALLRYVENSRKSTDADTVSNALSTIQASIISDNVAQGSYDFTVNGTGLTLGGSGGEYDKFDNALKSAYGTGYATSIKLKSNTWKTAGVKVTLAVAADGATTITYSDTTFTEFMEKGTNNNGAAANNNQQQNPQNP